MPLRTIALALVAATVAMATARAELAPASLVGAYEVTGTESDGKAYDGPGTLDISLSSSGALELDWDNGKYVGAGRVIGDTLAVGSFADGRPVIIATIANPDGSLTGKWWRHSDKGAKGTETWKKK
jgi:hypothetical protein